MNEFGYFLGQNWAQKYDGGIGQQIEMGLIHLPLCNKAPFICLKENF